MNNALLSGISGLQANQTMLDTTGNNLSNVNTYGFKSSRVLFSELLSQTMRAGTSPSDNTGGTNPMQMATGVSIGQIDRNMEQGSMITTGRALDMAIEGEGYFTLHDGQREVYTRVGAFAVDANYNLVDPATGYRVQRIGSTGVTDGFQNAYDNNIRIPYDVALPAKTTESISYSGNLSADDENPTVNLMTSGISYTVGGAVVSGSALLDNLDGISGLAAGDEITFTGTDADGTARTATIAINPAATSIQDLLDGINAQWTGATAKVVNGEIRLQDDAAGYSQTSIEMSYNNAGGGTAGSDWLPPFFRYLEVGGESAKPTNVEIFDAQGTSHTLSASFVKRDDIANCWDMVVTGITGDVDEIPDRRIEGITFLVDGSYAGLDSTIADEQSLQFIFGNDASSTRTVEMDFGTIGEFDGLSQFGGASTVAPNGQDGYGPGYLSSISVTREGVLNGIFTNGVLREIAEIRVSTFQNAAGLESVGKNYYVGSANSGTAVPTQALAGNAGAIRGGSLEKSNVDVAEQFVNLIQAQNGYQASAKTITVSNDMLRELTNLIR